ncbi:MAG: right-handed parallel beta-helix repeat-containing protein [bacterium]
MKISFLFFFLIIILFCTIIFSQINSRHIENNYLYADTILTETLPPSPVYEEGDLYVATNGSDETGLGTKEFPFKTITRALEQLEDGNIIVLRGGTYNIDEEVRIRMPNITIRSEIEEWAVISAPTDVEDITSCVYFDVESSGGKLQRIEIIGGYYYGIKTETKWDWGDPNDRSGASNILIEDCKIHDTGRDCIKITPNCDDITIRRCEIFNSGLRDDSNAEGIDNVNGDRMTVQDCYIHDIATNGIYFKGGATLCVAERTKIENCGVGGIMIGFDTSPEYFDLIVNPEYYENIYGIVRNCIISDTKYAGIGFYAAKNAKVYNNTIVNTAHEGHSPIYFGITFQDWEPEAGRPPTINPTIMNNIIYQPGMPNPSSIFIRYTDDLGGLSSLDGMPDMNNNFYFVENGSFIFTDRRPDSYVEEGSFEMWKNHISNETHSFEMNPLLDEFYHLSNNSNCIGNGTRTEYVSFDFDKQPRDENYDIGADEVSDISILNDEILSSFFKLFQNYPNPFNPATTIRYAVPTVETGYIPSLQQVTLKIYDILGNEVATLVNEQKAPGYYEVKFNASQLSSGVYFYRIVTGNFIKTMKMILLR